MPAAWLECADGVSQIFCGAPLVRGSIFIGVDTASSQPGELTLTLPSAQPALASDGEAGVDYGAECAVPAALIEELWAVSEAAVCGLTQAELGASLAGVGARHNWNQPPETRATAAQQAAFCRALRVGDLALAQACALGRDAAWERFVALYRAPLTQAAIAITGSATLGHELADSLYAELFGLATRAGERRSPLASYSGRGSLLGWLRTTLAQRNVDHHRRTYRETPLDAVEGTAADAAPAEAGTPLPADLARLGDSVARTLAALGGEERFLLAAYFLDQRTLLEIGRLLRVHEATVSRKLKRLTGDLRKHLLRNLQAGGLSRRAAEEALGADPRDLEVNLRALLQGSQPHAFSDKGTNVEPISAGGSASTGGERAADR
jgi:RNA polymerase sigma-70 factor (ECF subfamily)